MSDRQLSCLRASIDIRLVHLDRRSSLSLRHGSTGDFDNPIERFRLCQRTVFHTLNAPFPLFVIDRIYSNISSIADQWWCYLLVEDLYRAGTATSYRLHRERRGCS